MTVMTKGRLSAVAAAALIVVGIAAPGFAEGSRASHMTRWTDGDASSSWTDHNTDNVKTHVTFNDCTREFTATIRRTKTGLPDPSVASEHIDCKSYADAVYGGDLSPAKYHFDVTRIGIDHCVSGLGCTYKTTTVNSLHIYW